MITFALSSAQLSQLSQLSKLSQLSQLSIELGAAIVGLTTLARRASR